MHHQIDNGSFVHEADVCYSSFTLEKLWVRLNIL